MSRERASGVLLHPTSLPGPHGSGDLGEAARHFVDWLASAGQRYWQVLPLGGVGPGHSPYMSPSAFAGNPLLIDLADLVSHGWLTTADIEPAQPFGDGPVDFGRMIPWRMSRLALAAQRFDRQDDPVRREAFEAYRAEQGAWLDDYALFMALAEAHAPLGWCDWPAALARRDPRALAQARARWAPRVRFWAFCQWRFDRQWQALRDYAHARGVRLIGDVPIFVAHQSADVWSRPTLFELDSSGRPAVVAGVPPDYFSPTGQRWGNPLYRWPAHAASGYDWWCARLRASLARFDRVRIDHFRGLAAYWSIPADAPTAVEGRWEPGPGADFIEAVRAALGELPVIAEDLGIITPDVLALRRRFGWPGMRILQFAFGGDSANAYLPHNHDVDSVVYTGTHDNDTTRGWWACADESVRGHVRAYLGVDGSDIAWDLIRAACASVADLAIHPMQDVLDLGGQARMNRPGDAEGWWRWRFQWSQVDDRPARRLAEFARLYRRDGTAPPD